jgi:hypothetical protein
MSQQMEALAKANRVYRDRAILKRSVTSGDTTVAAVVLNNPPEAAGMTVYKLLIVQRGWGRTGSAGSCGRCRCRSPAAWGS